MNKLDVKDAERKDTFISGQPKHLSCKRQFLPCLKMNHIRDKPHEIIKAIKILYKTTKI
jgi:hypothetical protein